MAMALRISSKKRIKPVKNSGELHAVGLAASDSTTQWASAASGSPAQRSGSGVENPSRPGRRPPKEGGLGGTPFPPSFSSLKLEHRRERAAPFLILPSSSIWWTAFPTKYGSKPLYAPKDTLTQLSLTSHRLRLLSRVHLFAEFDFRPYAWEKVEARAFVKRSLQRLNFWASDEIAPLVRLCNATPFTSPAPVLSATKHPYDDALLTAFYRVIPTFANLRVFLANNVHFTRTAVANLCLLPKLHTLHVQNYRLAPEPVDLHALKLQNLSHLRIHNETFSMERIDHSTWISLLCPEKLRTLEFTLDPPHHLPINLPTFSHVHTLAVVFPLITLPQNMRILSNFPAVQVLSIRDAEDRYSETMWDGPGPHLPLDLQLPPLLRQYTGHFQTVNTFLSLPTVTHLSVISDMCTPAQFFEELQPSLFTNIVSLSIDFEYFNNALFDDLCGAFPALTRLCIRVANAEGPPLEDFELGTFRDWKVPLFLETLVTSFPSGIEQLSIFWNMDFESVDGVLPPFPRLGESLLKAHGSLNALWLGMYGFTVRARKSRDGKITVEERAIGEDEPWDLVRGISDDFRSSWAALDTAAV
ncbi:hypothetical protein B0H16DRAFT_1695779 [Mycena metata]|uniref:F-box domain-containing protein n=1 Tax=Mycena metata TaxID=1033252 RepID=A0AAD7MW35_9AGAR|nr:hypothetical protein B0H16DRAFT_1695779 [Mycena metata]